MLERTELGISGFEREEVRFCNVSKKNSYNCSLCSSVRTLEARRQESGVRSQETVILTMAKNLVYLQINALMIIRRREHKFLYQFSRYIFIIFL